MSKSNNQQPILSDAQRTITFSMEEAQKIFETFRSFSPDHLTHTIEEVAQVFLNNMSQIDCDMGNDFYNLRVIRDFYKAMLEPLLPIYNALDRYHLGK